MTQATQKLTTMQHAQAPCSLYTVSYSLNNTRKTVRIVLKAETPMQQVKIKAMKKAMRNEGVAVIFGETDAEIVEQQPYYI